MSNIDMTSVQKISKSMYTIFKYTNLLHEKCTKIIYNVLNENVVQISVNKWKTDLTDYNIEDLTAYDIFKTKTKKDFFVQWLHF